METASHDTQPDYEAQHRREVMLSYIERQAGIRAEMRELINADMQDSEAKVTWFNADRQLDKLLLGYVELDTA